MIRKASADRQFLSNQPATDVAAATNTIRQANGYLPSRRIWEGNAWGYFLCEPNCGHLTNLIGYSLVKREHTC